VWEADPRAWERDVRVNLFGTFLCSRAVLPVMLRQDSGVIVNLDGGGGSNGGNPAGSAYSSSKAGVVRFTETLASELGRIGSRVITFAINPGFVRSNLTEALAGHAWQAQVRADLASGRDVPPGDCGRRLVDLLGIAGPDLNGRTFDEHTEAASLARRRRTMVRHRLYLMRTGSLHGFGLWRRRPVHRLARLVMGWLT
jgi:NAD(P)-dependent dehydrogenase (short-subunit alcohol dehydrogenase family)